MQRGNCGLSQTEKRHTAGAPIWLAALAATGCEAISARGCHAVGWQWSGGRAIYTNASAHPEWIQPLGVTLDGGQTLSVTWIPGETEYTLDVDRPPAKCA
jgi:hypothetical protein